MFVTIAAQAPLKGGPTAPVISATDDARYEESLHYVRVHPADGSEPHDATAASPTAQQLQQRSDPQLVLRPLSLSTSSAGAIGLGATGAASTASAGVTLGAGTEAPSRPSSSSTTGTSSTSSSSTVPVRPRSHSALPAPASASASASEFDGAESATTTTESASSSRSSKRHRAKMAARAMSKPLRKSYVGMVAGLASTVGLGQAMFLKATYQSPPDARGPRSGVERPHPEDADALTSAEGHVTRVQPHPEAAAIAGVQMRGPALAAASNDAASVAAIGAPPAASAGVDAAGRAALASAADRASPRKSAAGASVPPTSKLPALPPVKGIANASRGAAAATAAAQQAQRAVQRQRILIIGDSLVSGVGGESSFDNGPSDGPALPRQVARYLSEMLRVDVQWNAMSLTGGDVRMLRRKIIPMLARERERGTIGHISAVVVVTGVNDWKRMSPFRTASKFRDDLKEFIEAIREHVGQECKVFLPAIPGVRHTPRFHEPLRSIVTFLNDLWDSQKLQLSRSVRDVYFVGQPANHEWGANPVEYFSTLDRVHPSEYGYQRWAERIAQRMTTAFQRSGDVAKESALDAVVASQPVKSEASQTTTKSDSESSEASPENSAKVSAAV